MNKDERQVMQQKINTLQHTLEEYRLYADFSLAMQMITHNIKNSTAGSIGSAEVIGLVVNDLLKKIELDLLTTDDLKSELEQIKIFSELTTKSIQKIETLSHEILQKGKTDKSHHLEKFDLNELIRNEIHFLQYTSPFVQSKITIHSNLSPTPVIISARKHDIVQVFENLLHNAIESMKGKGEITITTISTNESVHFSISDTGPGIDNQHLDKIFEPFFTTKKTTDKYVFFGGTGLGLHSCKKLIDSYQGDITVEGHLNPGSRFTVKLPRTT